MRIIPTALLAGAGSLALIGAAAAHGLPTHRMTVQLPNGAIEEIEYSGSTAPAISIVPAQTAPAANGTDATLFASPVAAFGPNSPFAMMERISDAMNREAAMLFRQVDALAMQPLPASAAPLSVDMTRMPRGAEGYSFVATLTPSGACSQSTEIIAAGHGTKRHVITRRTGDCGGATGMPALDRTPYPTSPQHQHHVQSVKAVRRAIPARGVEQVAWRPY